MRQTSNWKSLVAYHSSDPNDILDGIQKVILKQRSWGRFSDLDKEATSELSLAAFPKGFIAMNGYGVLRSVIY